MIGVGSRWKEKKMREERKSEDFFHNPGYALLNVCGRIS